MPHNAVESIHPLSPMQQGMLFHALYSPNADVYVEQFACRFDGPLDVAALRRAWHDVIVRHPALRTSFHAMDGAQPVQVVHDDVELPWLEEDWRGSAEPEQERRLAAFLRDDRARGFDPARPPLHRFALFRLSGAVHQFVWTHHHVLLDGWSVPLVLRELTACYNGHRHGEPARLPPARPFHNYLAWLDRQDAEATRAFWRQHLSGYHTPVPLPLSEDEPAEPEPGPHTERHELTAGHTADLTNLARTHGLTLGTLVHAAWAVLLSRYGGVRDLVHGMTVSGRPPNLPGVEDMVGLFINTLPIRVRVPTCMSTVDWLRELQDDLVRMRQYEHASLVQVQGWSDVPRGIPLFDSLVVVENFPVGAGAETDFGGAAITHVTATEQTNYPLTLVAIPGERLRLRLIHDSARFAAATARTLLAGVANVLTGIAARPHRPVGELSLLSDRARRELVGQRPATGTDYPRERGLYALFAERVADGPDAVALVAGDRELTYRKLAARAGRLTAALRGLGVRPGGRVGVFLDRSPELVVALLGVVRAGAAYVPLDPSYPAERLAFMAADSRLDAVVTMSGLRSAAPPGVTVLCLDEPAGGPAGASAEPARVCGEALAYVMYTSGSTGTPKGVAVPHRAVTRLVCDTDYVDLRPDDRVAFASNTAFDAATFELWGALLHGAALVVVDTREALAPVAYAALIREGALTTLFLTTALVNQVAAAVPGAFAPMRQVLFGGEAVDPDSVRAILRAGPPRRLLHVYGPTESTTFATWHQVGAVPERAVTVPIGKALANTSVRVLDAAGEPVPPGAVGHLFLGGDGLSHGYHRRPALTAERFVPDPHDERPGSRLYRTGDLVRARPDGALVFVGRTDHQVKLRGYRIELGEVEAALRCVPAVAEAVVAVREDVPGDRRLVAYVAPADVEPADLRAHCAQRLPDYMVPSVFVPLARLPLTPNGKLDRDALPAVGTDQLDTGAAYVPPRPGIEDLLAELWAQILGVARVGRTDNFFTLGGHSLLATQLQTRLRTTLAREVPLRTIFETPTLAALAAALDASRHGEDDRQAAAIPPLRPVDRSMPPPLSFPQQRLWFLEQWEPGTSLYHISGAVRLHGELDVQAFQAAWHAVVDRHESLRTYVSDTEAAPPRQAVTSAEATRVPVVDLRTLPDGVRDVTVRDLVRATFEVPFELTAGPLWRILVLRLGYNEHVLAICLHHLIADGESMGVLLTELGAHYRAGGRAALPPLPVQYGDYAAWQHSWLHGERLAEGLAYWRRQLAGATTTLPTDRPRWSANGLAAATTSVLLSSDVDTKLRELSRRSGVTGFMALFAAFAVALGQSRELDEVVVGTPVANRTEPELEGAIGFFANTLVLRLDLGGDPTFRQLLDRAREVCLGAYAYQSIPFERVVNELAPERDAGYLPIFQTWFVVQDEPPVADTFPGLRLEPVGTSDRLARYDLRLDVQRSATGLRGVFEYKVDLFEAASIARLTRRFERVLRLAVAYPDVPLATLSRRLVESDNELRHSRHTKVTLVGLHRLKNARREAVRATDRGDA
jgi:amino acid adenylation domain-containing protein